MIYTLNGDTKCLYSENWQIGCEWECDTQTPDQLQALEVCTLNGDTKWLSLNLTEWVVDLTTSLWGNMPQYARSMQPW